MIKTISKIGNSQGILFDAALLELVHLKRGDEVNVEVHEGGYNYADPDSSKAHEGRDFAGHQIHHERLLPDDEEAGMKRAPNECFYLTVEIVSEIHAQAIEAFGGAEGIRDMALLESAVAAPQASFGGKSPFADPTEVAAAYLFYLCRNHPFLDGNKRAALGACLVFLRLNGIDPKADGPAWEKMTLAVAASAIDRQETTQLLRKLIPT